MNFLQKIFSNIIKKDKDTKNSDLNKILLRAFLDVREEILAEKGFDDIRLRIRKK